MHGEQGVIRHTTSVCPECLKVVDARIVERAGGVFMEKRCGEHGMFTLLVSCDAAYYRELNDFYFGVMPDGLPQRDFMVHLTNRCNLDCPICLASANLKKNFEYRREDLAAFLQGKKGFKIDLMGAEPTMRDDLPAIVRMIADSGNIAALHTNGIRLAEKSYLAGLKTAGLAEVHLQFDGFDDAVYRTIRGKEVLAVKLQALENLKSLDIATDIVATIMRGVNESEMVRILDYAAAQRFVKEVFFLGCRFLGKAKEAAGAGQCMMPDELIDLLAAQTRGKIQRAHLLIFQKLYFSLLAVFRKRKCFYIHHYLLVRDGASGYLPLNEIIDFPRLGRRLDAFLRLRTARSPWAYSRLIWALAGSVSPGAMVRHAERFVRLLLPFVRGFNLSKLSDETLLLGFISACDAYSLDYQIARHCGKGSISAELGIQDTGAIDNVLRDRCMG